MFAINPIMSNSLPFLLLFKIIFNKYMCAGKCILKPSSIKPCEMSNQDENRMMNDLSIPINLTQLSPLSPASEFLLEFL